jgi:hypothetical protein
MKVINSSVKSSVSTYNAWHYNPQEHNPNFHCHENFKRPKETMKTGMNRKCPFIQILQEKQVKLMHFLRKYVKFYISSLTQRAHSRESPS